MQKIEFLGGKKKTAKQKAKNATFHLFRIGTMNLNRLKQFFLKSSRASYLIIVGETRKTSQPLAHHREISFLFFYVNFYGTNLETKKGRRELKKTRYCLRLLCSCYVVLLVIWARLEVWLDCYYVTILPILICTRFKRL